MSAKKDSKYWERNSIVRLLGFRTYTEYLESDIWEDIRVDVLTSATECVACDRRPTQVHHEEYTRENLSGASLEFLHGICRRCHYEIEFTPTGRKRTLERANSKLRQLVTRKSKLVKSISRESQA